MDIRKLTDDCDVDLLQLIGHGSVGVVHMGKLDVAVKRIYFRDNRGLIDEEKLALANKEITNFQKLKSHNNIVQFHSFKNDDKSIWIIMENCDLGSLEKYMGRYMPDLNMKLKIMTECVEGIRYMHSQKVIHYDIKPSNILMKHENGSDVVKISDLSGSGQLGTEEFMAPERFSPEPAKHNFEEAVQLDVFSLGLVFLVILLFSEEHMTMIPSIGEADSYLSVGEAMYTAKTDGINMPHIFEASFGQADVHVPKIKEIIVRMTSYEALGRIALQDVLRLLHRIEFLGQGETTIRGQLMQKYEHILNEVRAIESIPNLLKQGIISSEEKQNISREISANGNIESVKLLMDYIFEGPDERALKFKQYLSGKYRWFANVSVNEGIKHYASENVRERITRNYKKLVEHLDQTDMIRAELFSNGIISMEEYEYTQREYYNKGRIASNRLLLDTLLKKPKEEYLLKFAETLADYPVNELLLEDVHDQVSTDIEDMETNSSVVQTHKEMEQNAMVIKLCIQIHFQHLIESIDPESVLDALIVHNAIDLEAHQHVSMELLNKGATASNRLLLRYMLKGSKHQILSFAQVLKKHLPWLWAEIKKSVLNHQEQEEKYMRDLQLKFTDMYQRNSEKQQDHFNEQNYISPIFKVSKLMIPQTNTEVTKRRKAYMDIPFVDINSLIADLQANTQGRVALVTGNPATGKTYLVHKLLCDWLTTSHYLHDAFKALVLIQVRNVNLDEDISQILKGSIAFNSPSSDDDVLSFAIRLNSKYVANRTLIILDGLDELKGDSDNDLSKLINGEIYPHCKLLITSRTVGPLLEGVSNPSYIVSLDGISTEAFCTYVMSKFRRYNLEYCELNLKQYLNEPIIPNTLLAHVVNKYWSKYNMLQLLKTRTGIVTLVVQSLLQNWLQRIGRVEEGNCLHLIKQNPIHPTSSVPIDIKSKVHLFARQGYSMFARKEQVIDIELVGREYFIEPKDIIDSGLYCTSQYSKTQYTFIHKSIQEYLTALYLANQSFSDSKLYVELLSVDYESEQIEETLHKFFDSYHAVLQFLAGISPQFMSQLLLYLKSNIQRFKLESSLELDYKILEEVIAESDEDNLSKALFELSDTISNPSVKSLMSICQTFDDVKTKHLLEHMYGICVNTGSDDITAGISTSSDQANDGNIRIKSLTLCTYLLSSKYRFADVRTLVIESSKILHVGLLNAIFSQVNELNIQDGLGCNDGHLEMLETHSNQDPTLTHIRIFGMTYNVIPKCSLQAILCQTHLRYLQIYNMDPLKELHKCEISGEMLANLQQLDLMVKDISEPNPRIAGEFITSHNLMRLLSHVRHLKQLGIFCVGLHRKLSELKCLLDTVLENGGELQVLRLYNVLSGSGFDILSHILPKLTNLRTLGLGLCDLEMNISQLRTTFCAYQHIYIRSFEILHGDGFGEAASELKSSITEHLSERKTLSLVFSVKLIDDVFYKE